MGGFFKDDAEKGIAKKIELTVEAPNTVIGASAKKISVGTPIENIIKKLTTIRQSNYKVPVVNTIISSDYPVVQNLILQLGNKILKANSNPNSLDDAKHQFAMVAEGLIKNSNKFAIVSFASQLLQYFTIVSDGEFTAGTSLEDFQLFLDNNADRLGTVNNNLFVTEYKLIKIYNDLIEFTDSITGKIATTKNIAERVDFLLVQLNLIKKQINQWLLDAPDNIFIHYLDFSLNYSCAKAFELHYHIQSKALTDEEKIFMSASQDVFILAAKNSLGRIDEIKTAAQERGNSMVSGMEYSLGQNVLIKLPAADPGSLKSHLSNLLR